MNYTKYLVNDYECRKQMVVAFSFCGYPVYVEIVEESNTYRKNYFVCIGEKYDK